MKDTGNSIGAITPENMHTRSKAAWLVNRSPDTLKRWHRQGLCVPSGSMQAGQLKVWLYSDTDIHRLKEIAKSQKPGRKKSGGSGADVPSVQEFREDSDRVGYATAWQATGRSMADTPYLDRAV